MLCLSLERSCCWVPQGKTTRKWLFSHKQEHLKLLMITNHTCVMHSSTRHQNQNRCFCLRCSKNNSELIHRETRIKTVYLLKLLEILGIQLILYFWCISCLHIIQLLPWYPSKPWMCLCMRRSKVCISGTRGAEAKSHVLQIMMYTLTSSTPRVPSRWSTSQSSLHIRSLASADSLASSGNFKYFLQ